MTNHMSVRLAWHDNGWNGRICDAPALNVYCIGQHSYLGDVILEQRSLEMENKCAGERCKDLHNGYVAPCSVSMNAFGADSVSGHLAIPKWMEGQAKGLDISIPPSTAFTWGYEGMYTDDVKASAAPGRTYDHNLRETKAKEHFDSFTNNKSLLFYYANYSNPFCEDDSRRYVVVGISRLKGMMDYQHYDDCTEKILADYAKGLIWQKGITSCYPDEGFHIPYEKYRNNPDILDRIVFFPDNPRSFKYASRAVADDEAIQYVSRFIEIVDVLIEIGDDTENWQNRKEWLNRLLAELWKNRGPYPGIPAILEWAGLSEFIGKYLENAITSFTMSCWNSCKTNVLSSAMPRSFMKPPRNRNGNSSVWRTRNRNSF